MAERPKGFKRWLVAGLAAVAVVILAAGVVWREDILRTGLDPKVPFQTYTPPPAPDYGEAQAWSLRPMRPQTWRAEDPAADVFFVGPTTYEGGRHWNAPIGEPKAERLFRRVMAPNYAGPFVRVGRLFAPRYRQASLYTLLTLREDAREARRFAYGDVARAFRHYRDHYNKGRPFILVGVEQGGTLAARLLAEEIAPDPELRRRLVAAYLVETAVPRDETPVPACAAQGQAGCLAAWLSAPENEPERAQTLLDRSLVWSGDGQLENLHGRAPLCFNPVLGVVTEEPAPARAHLGAANATGLEWEARPAFLARQVATRCVGGILRVSTPRSPSLKRTGAWAERRMVPGYNLFYADLEADAKARLAALLRDPDFPHPAPPIEQLVEVGDSPVHRID